MKRIPLTSGLFAKVDDEDFIELSKLKWFAHHGYAERNSILESGRKTTISMHRVILNTPVGMQTDHINHDTLDNRRKNLRVVTRTQNQMNSKMRNGNVAGFKGVSFGKERRGKKFRALITIGSKQTSIGYFHTAIEAARAYNEAAKKYYGEFALLNKIK